MANQEQLEILKQGVEVWNKWREGNPKADIDLSRAKLRKTHLSGTDLTGADLRGADLRGAELLEAVLKSADLRGANLRNAILREANLRGADIREADLTGALLIAADLRETVFRKAILREAYLNGAILIGADLTGAILMEADLAESFFARRIQVAEVNFCNLDLSGAKGLENVRHLGPSTIGTDTIALSKGKIPEAFLRGCGLSDWEIEMAKLYNPDLSYDEFIDIQNRIFDLRKRQAFQLSPLFVSYSHADGAFVDKVGNALTEKGIRYWRDIHEMKAGRVETQIDRAIRHNPIVLLVLTSNSIKSDWVEHEVRTARELEKEMGRDVLCPVALDDSWKSSPWPKRVMEQVMEYNILDFSEWEDDSKFENMFRRLIDGLELFYKR